MTAERFMLGLMILLALLVIGLRQTRKALFNAFKPKPQCPATLAIGGSCWVYCQKEEGHAGDHVSITGRTWERWT